MPSVCLCNPPLSTSEWLNQSLWNLVCISWHQSPHLNGVLYKSLPSFYLRVPLSFLGNGSVKNTHATTELLGAHFCFLCGLCLIKERRQLVISSWGGVQYLHRSPASRRRLRKGNAVPGGITGPPCWGSLEPETVKCGHDSRGSRTWEWLRSRGPAPIVNYRPILSSERTSYKDYECKYSVEKKCWSWVSWGLSPRRTDWQ
jgi:hypothetical protein